MKYCFPSGAFDDKHTSILECAQHELDEEAHLNGGEWIPLFTRDNRGIPEGKWISNSFMPFLCINPLINSKPAERDAEEYMNIISNVTMSDLKSYIMTGQLLLPSVQAAVMGLEMLKSKNLIKETLI